jgi:hypothetical protein
VQQRRSERPRAALARLARRPAAPVREVGGLPPGAVVVTGLVGGLGNQMFQYAAARAVTLRTGATLALDLSWFPTQSKQQFGLAAFPIRATVLDPTQPLPGETRRLPVVKERGFHFQPALLTAAPSCYLEGYWQSERYFEAVADDIRREFWIDPPPEVDLFRPTDQQTAVSVHVRRGDYVAEPETRAYHGTCSLEYYARAMDLVRRLVPGARFFLFSDDPAWVQANLGGADTVVVSELHSPAHRDLLLMAQCRHHVLANSSFSWWGAWLSQPGGVTVAPRPWFLTPENNTKDLLPPAWLSIGI